MTRFARAKGSKASNERVVADRTPWHEMKNGMLKRKQEIEEEKNRREAEAKRNENYQKFLKERDEEATKHTEWAEFPESDGPKLNGVSTKSKTIKKQKNVVKDGKMKTKAVLAMKNGAIEFPDQNSEIFDSSEALGKKIKKKKLPEQNCEINDSSEKPEKIIKKKKLKIIEDTEGAKINIKQNNYEENVKKNTKSKHIEPSPEVQDSINGADDDESPMEISSKVEEKEPVIKQVKKKKVKTIIPKEDLKESEDKEITENVKKGKKKKQNKQNETANDDTTDLDKKKKGPKNESKKQKVDFDSLSEEAKKKILKKQEKRRKQVEKKKLKKLEKHEEIESSGVENPATSEITKTEGNKFNKPVKNFVKSNATLKKEAEDKKLKKAKFERGEIKRRKDFQPDTIIVNGNKVELEYFDGYPIKKEDAKNLMKLKKEMISKGLPRSEINRTLKLERRRAEKALAREKKQVCFNCRKFGHNLSECPNLSNKNELVGTTADGVCFKCGSTEHTSFACRVVKGDNFKFASCFICKEQGHISRQCPDNARGLYPKGGSCRVCGDVTHLKKDCPQHQEQQKKEEAKFQVDTIFDGNPDDLIQKNAVPKKTQSSTKMKVIKF